MTNQHIDLEGLASFIDRAQRATYVGGGEYIQAERAGFHELEHREGEWYYRDSYTGFTRSRGTEVVRFNDEIVWSASYGGGMIDGFEDSAGETFTFLKEAMVQPKGSGFVHRGPASFSKDEWRYLYTQEGDVDEFSGYEEIYAGETLVFFHRVIGGVVRG